MKVSVDKELCVGCGLCSDSCPDVFEMKDNIAVFKIDEVPADLEDCAKQAAADCPAEAIKIE